MEMQLARWQGKEFSVVVVMVVVDELSSSERHGDVSGATLRSTY